MKDLVYKKSKGKEVVELLIDNVWVPAMATDLRIINKLNDLVRVEEIRVRTLHDK